MGYASQLFHLFDLNSRGRVFTMRLRFLKLIWMMVLPLGFLMPGAPSWAGDFTLEEVEACVKMVSKPQANYPLELKKCIMLTARVSSIDLIKNVFSIMVTRGLVVPSDFSGPQDVMCICHALGLLMDTPPKFQETLAACSASIAKRCLTPAMVNNRESVYIMDALYHGAPLRSLFKVANDMPGLCANFLQINGRHPQGAEVCNIIRIRGGQLMDEQRRLETLTNSLSAL